MNEIVCIKCPIGCRIQVSGPKDHLSISGYSCPRGKQYAEEETVCPKRIVTCLVKVEGSSEPLSVKTAGEVPKEKIFDVISAIKALRLCAPVELGEVLIPDVCGTGVCVISTKAV